MEGRNFAINRNISKISIQSIKNKAFGPEKENDEYTKKRKL